MLAPEEPVVPQPDYVSLEARLAALIPATPTIDTKSFVDYLKVANYHHQKESDFTLRYLVFGVPIIILCWVIAGIASSVYIDYARKDAGENHRFRAWVNVFGALTINTILNYFFEYLVLSPPIKKFSASVPDDVREAEDNLEGLTPGLLAKLLRGFLAFGTFLIVLLPAIAAAFQMYALDKKEGTHSEFRSLMVLLASVFLMLASAKSVLFRMAPTALLPLAALRRQLSPAAKKDYQIANAQGALKAAISSAFEEVRVAYNELYQKGKMEILHPLIALQKKKPANDLDTFQLIYKYLLLVPPKSYEYRIWLRRCFQILSLPVTTGSVWGLIKITKDGVVYVFDHYLKMKLSSGAAWGITIPDFLISVAIAYDVSWDVTGQMYERAEYALHGIKEAWKKSATTLDFFSFAVHHLTDMAAWYNLVRLPRAFIQNPKTMLILNTLILGLCYFSTQTSTAINPAWLFIPTVIAVMQFNFNPFPWVTSEGQALVQQGVGTQENKDVIRCEKFLEAMIAYIDRIDDVKYLKVLMGFLQSGKLSQDQQEALLSLFCGKKTCAEVFDSYPLNSVPLRQSVPLLAEGNMDRLRMIGFFKADNLSPEKQATERTALLKAGELTCREPVLKFRKFEDDPEAAIVRL